MASLLALEGYEIEALVEGVSSFDEDDLVDCAALLVHFTAGNIDRTARLVDGSRRGANIQVIGWRRAGRSGAVGGRAGMRRRRCAGEAEGTTVEMLVVLASGAMCAMWLAPPNRSARESCDQLGGRTGTSTGVGTIGGSFASP